ncbi:hypothetical protein [Carboxylicivirga sp. M1479]|uniref:hypothetical protein n=1 Tax=Carboxylicivirga sp. M1479 TaxID=2594476 RepID=UPI001177444F|nr:hypothetical protein [Carboxylicivirga sp. M1479]TRX72274.1 hypothetical protein FNN09_02560 [Carboxylicivirga sp. M1479]
MDDLGNILYIIAMLAALVISALKKQKKARAKEVMPDTNEPMQPSVEEEDILADLKDLFQQSTEKKEKVVPVQKPKPKHVPLHMQAKPQVKTKVRNVVQKPLDLKHDEYENDGFEFDKEQIDLREAVIYSEILNRPYE